MRIQITGQYKSIGTLTTEELPDFTVLIGRNGAGKTQVLRALEEGVAVVSGIGVDEIEFFDMVSFQPPNANTANRHSNQFAQITSDAYLLTLSGGQPPIKTAAAIFKRFISEMDPDPCGQGRARFEQDIRDEIRQLPDFTVFAESDQDSPYKAALFEQVLVPLLPEENERQRRRSANRPRNQFYGNRAALISAAMKLNGKLPHELTHEDIMHAAHYEGNTLSNSISEVFTTYRVDQFVWTHRRIETERVGFDELVAEYRATYPPPWETLREILSTMRDAAGDDGLFNFDFSDPDGFDLRMDNYEAFTFKTEMTNRTSGAQYELDSLSSGEKILMALCLVSFNQYLGRRTPKLLLLDELDAVLHPSMITALVKTLKALFVSQGTRVLMTSHSPMTVAALDEDVTFRVVRRGNDVEIVRTTKPEAIDELSEGLATVDMGLRIAASDSAPVTILTEGHNAKHLKRWVYVNGLSNDVYVFEGLEQHSNHEALLSYGRLLARMNTNTHFVIVWDCDASSKAQRLGEELPKGAKITPFAFTKREDNSIANKGIENTYDEEFLAPYSTETKRNDGTLLNRGFDNSRKTEFADHVQQNGTAQHFTHFQDLHAIVSGILIAAGKSNSQTSSVQ